jgi:hypothetical protein
MILALALPGPALAQDAPDAPTDAREWTVVSHNSEMEARQKPAGDGCHLEVVRGSTVVWKAEKCLGDRDDAHFVSNDGLGLIRVRTFPENHDLNAALKAETGIEVYRRGELVKRLPVGRFVVSVPALVKATRHFYWLEGALGQDGVPPGFSKDGKAIELSTLDRKSWSVGFDGSVKKIAMPKPLVH